MKILHIVGSFLNGGIETLLVNVANQQTANGHEVGIIFITNRIASDLINSINPSVKKYFVKKPVGSKNPYYLYKLNYYYRIFKPRVLHLHGSNFTSLLLGKLKSEKRFVTLHNNVIDIHYSNSVDQYIAISECVRESYIRQTRKTNCVVCYNGIPLNNYISKQVYPEYPCKIVCVGRVLFDVKGQDVMVSALARLKGNGYSFSCDFYGDGKDLDRLKELIVIYNLQEQVRALGNASNEYIAKHLHQYDIAVQASRHEGLGISAIESMACGVPTILSAVDGFLEVSQNGKFTKLFTNESVDELSQTLGETIDNYAEACELALKAKQYIMSKFSISNMVEELDTIYKS